jgi:hypothetical protein
MRRRTENTKGNAMKKQHAMAGFLCIMGTLTVSLGIAALTPQDQKPAGMPEKRSATTAPPAQGRYITMMGGCNDCHTPGFAEANGKTPEADWLTGGSMGYYGPWGTSYPANLRLLVSALSEDAWLKSARELKTLPPMPWWVLHEMREPDLRDMYRLIKSLGPKGGTAPADLAPEQKPKPPYVAFVLKSEK